MSGTSGRESLLRELTPVVADLGLDLEDVVVAAAGRRRLLRVVVDQDGGIELDQVARVSTAISAALDSSGAMGESPYVLEVTSPGVDRPLTQPRHWRRNEGRLVEAVLTDGSTLTGRVMDVSAAGPVVDVAGTGRLLPWGEVKHGRVHIEFAPTAAAGPRPARVSSGSDGSEG